MGGVRVDELREEGEEEEGDLRVEGVDEDALREDAPEPKVAATRRLDGAVSGEERPEPETDEIRGARVLDDGEGDGRGREQGREPDGCRGHVHESADLDPEHRRDARAPALVHAARDDVEDSGAGNGDERSRRESKDCKRSGIDHRFSSQTICSPSSVRNGSTLAIVRECGATRSASPPVAIACASASSSSRMRPTIPSTCPANP